jgi:autoinducer 2-degrading protein
VGKTIAAPTGAEPPRLAILFRVEARAGRQLELLNFLKQDSWESREEPGTLRFDVLTDPATDRAFYVYEVYENAEAFNAHKKGLAYERWSSDDFQVHVLAECCAFRKLAEGEPVALMPSRWRTDESFR